MKTVLRHIIVHVLLISAFMLLLVVQAIAGWSRQTSGTTLDLTCVRFVNEQKGWALGRTAVYSDLFASVNGGKNWVSHPWPFDLINDLFFVNSTTGWAVGRNRFHTPISSVVKTIDGGDSWFQPWSFTENNDIHAVHFVDTDYGWTVASGVGSIGIVSRTNNGGTTWSSVSLMRGISSLLTDVCFVNRTVGWVVGIGHSMGGSGFVLKTTDGGMTWEDQRGGVNSDFFNSVFFADEMNGWVAGSKDGWGLVLRTTDGGVNWSEWLTDVSLSFNSVHFINAVRGWVVGWNGTIYTTYDGGINWIQQSSGTTEHLNSVFFQGPNLGWAVGANGTILKYSSSPTQYKFAVVGDTHLADPDEPPGFNSTSLERLKSAVVLDGAEFVLFASDLVGRESQLPGWRDIMKPLHDAGVKIYPCRGNNMVGSPTDWVNTIAGSFGLPMNGPPGEQGLTYSFVNGNALFLAMDEAFSNSQIPLTLNQAWLSQQLASNRLPHVFVFGHAPAFDLFNPAIFPSAIRDPFLNSIANAGGRTYFAAHNHMFDHARLDNGDGNPNNDLHQFVVGKCGGAGYPNGSYSTTGNQAWRPAEGLHRHHDVDGYLLVSVDNHTVTLTERYWNASGVLSSDYSFSYTLPWNAVPLANTGFELGTTGWTKYTPQTTDINFTTEPNGPWGSYAKLHVNRISNNMQMYQSYFPLTAGKRYMLSFDAYSPTARKVHVSVMKHSSNPAYYYGLNPYVQLTAGWRHYEFPFTAGGFAGTTTDTRLRFYFVYLCQAGDDYFFDNVELKQSLPKEGETKELTLPTSYVLEQNYPNPFNPTTTIKFQIPNDGHVSLKVFDVLGREVKSLVNEVRVAGSYTETLDATGLSSGMYFYRLESGSFTRTMKMIIMK